MINGAILSILSSKCIVLINPINRKSKMPMIGYIKLEGYTVREVEKLLEEKLTEKSKSNKINYTRV